MEIIAVDPGLTIGLAYYNTSSKKVEAFQTSLVKEVEDWLCDRWTWTSPDVFIVEDYISAGNLTKQAKTTIKLLGYFQFWFESDTTTTTLVRVPQRRLSSVAEARKMCEDLNIEGPHSWDALAHALAYAREQA